MSDTNSSGQRFPTFAKLRPAVPWLRRGLLAFVGLMVLYALSFGPALFLAQRRIVATDTIESLYSPLQTAMVMIPGGHVLMKWYVAWWESLTPMPGNEPGR